MTARTTTNRVRQRLQSGRPAVGATVWSGSPSMAELLAALDFDFVFLDMEHSPYNSLETIAHLFRAIESRGGSPWVRVPQLDPHIIAKVAELGAQGIVVPHIMNAEEADLAAKAVLYPPSGNMGACALVRQFDYKWDNAEDHTELLDRIERLQRDIIVIGLVEDIRALDNLDEILETGIHGLWPGTGDMSWTFSNPETRFMGNHPEVEEARLRVVEKCVEHGKPAMTSLGSITAGGASISEAMAEWIPKGMQIFHAGVDLQVVFKWGRNVVKDLDKAPDLTKV